MSNEERIRESIDSCRPASADLDLPEFEALRDAVCKDATQKQILERSQAFDTAVGEQIRSVEIPSGLVERLFVGLDLPREDVPTSLRRSNDRFWVAAGWRTTSVATSLALLIAVGAYVMFRPEPVAVPTLGELQGAAIEWPDSLALQWRSVQESPDNQPPPPGFGWRMQPYRWQLVDLPIASKVICYEFPIDQDAEMYVFALPARSARVSSTSPLQPPFTTRGRSVRLWRGGDFLYVLVLNGAGENRFQELMRRHRRQAA